MIRKLRGLIRRVAYSDKASGLVMLAFAALGLLVVNLPLTAGPVHFLSEIRVSVPWTNIDLPVSEWAQDGLLTLFFLTVGLDLKQELVSGSLSNPRRAAVPMVAAVGGMVAPPLIYLGVTSLMGVRIGTVAALLSGWPIPTATDIAFSLAVLAIFAHTLPTAIRSFLLTLATVDDLLGILLIAFLFSSLHQWYWFVGLAACALIWTTLCRRRRVPWPLVGLVGILAWVMMFEAGIHPTLSGVLVGLLTPAHRIHGESSPRAKRYHHRLLPWSSLLALPIFAFFATGVELNGLGWSFLASPLVIGLILALVIGKPLGIMAISWLAVHFGRLKLARGLRVRDLIGISCACGIGFTVSFLIASLAFRGSEFTGEARIGVLLGSCLSALIAGAVLSWQVRQRKLSKPQQASQNIVEE